MTSSCDSRTRLTIHRKRSSSGLKETCTCCLHHQLLQRDTVTCHGQMNTLGIRIAGNTTRCGGMRQRLCFWELLMRLEEKAFIPELCLLNDGRKCQRQRNRKQSGPLPSTRLPV